MLTSRLRRCQIYKIDQWLFACFENNARRMSPSNVDCFSRQSHVKRRLWRSVMTLRRIWLNVESWRSNNCKTHPLQIEFNYMLSLNIYTILNWTKKNQKKQQGLIIDQHKIFPRPIALYFKSNVNVVMYGVCIFNCLKLFKYIYLLDYKLGFNYKPNLNFLLRIFVLKKTKKKKP